MCSFSFFQAQKAILDQELDLITHQNTGEDTTELMKKVEELKQEVLVCNKNRGEAVSCVHTCNNLFKLIANWWPWKLVPSKVGGGPVKIPGTAWRFHGNPVSGNQSCKWPPTSTVTLKELQWRNLPDPIPTMNHFVWGVRRARHWIGKIGKQSSDPKSSTEQANCKYGDQSSDPSKVVITKISRADNCKYGD